MIDYSLYLVTDPQLGGGPGKVADIVERAIAGGVSVVQLRDKEATAAEFLERALELKAVTDAQGVPLFVNDRVEVAVELGLHLHIGQGDMSYPEARRLLPEPLKLGLTIENGQQLEECIRQCREQGVRLPDVVGLGPVLDTPTKPNAPAAVGVEGVAELAPIAAAQGMASVAIGGVGAHNAIELAATATDGLCVVSAVMAVENPRAAAAELRATWEKHHQRPAPSCPRVLSIAGTDPSGGAGLQADLKSFTAAGGYGMAVVTSLVAQNTRGVRSIHTPPLDFLEEQLAAVFEDVEVDAIKIGMLGSADITAVVSRWLEEQPHGPVVLDPVMIATSGDRLLDADAESAIRELAAKVDVVTPNLPELAVLCEQPEAEDLTAAIEQAQVFAAATNTVVIVKGGHLRGPAADNAVVHPHGFVHHVPNPRVNTSNTHGTGCSLSAALATRIAAGQSVEDALEWSTAWLNESLRGADALQVGKGNGPVDHSHLSRRLARAGDPTPWAHLQAEPLNGADANQLLPATAVAPLPRIAPAGPYTQALWEGCAEIIAEITASPFIRGLGDGTLSPTQFLTYLSQDAHYLREYSRSLALLGAKAPDAVDQVAWAESAAECLVAEAELHRTHLGTAGLAVKTIAAPSPATAAYTDFLLARTAVDDYVVGAAAVLPCYWLYAEVGLMLAEQNHPDHPFHDWLATYAGEDFLAGTRVAIQRVEKALESAAPQQRVRAARAFLSASVHEREFFDQASRMGLARGI
ncbi:Hydroxymethylpyrimidine/phosphomethylpyrimidine kinase [Corynebacterium occultum]|uniref:Thiamine-phosphate synthase n=1 Tax=Corynebacterium occultum TaxID=2675219 RepID=A0A6B8VP58_9CORY|nr:bifunctional hydroxymethylpyrimidine kinase/phosphomethylpyrimidine kinase [Corynebacterium occultum]QGU07352.1 Hydroxymethylpyrimidine/phosphomethylpyrimidine kinase [Corynebacterium occultum]